MPVFFSKPSSVGIFLPESSTSMYSGQLEKLSTFSLELRSSLTQSSADCFVPAVPHAASTPPAPTATAE